jgi:hypothetical protein
MVYHAEYPVITMMVAAYLDDEMEALKFKLATS